MAEAEALLLLVPVVTFVFGSWLERRDQRAARTADRELIADLHSRLASRNYAEYATLQPAYALSPSPDDDRRLVVDDTGLMVFDAPDTDE